MYLYFCQFIYTVKFILAMKTAVMGDKYKNGLVACNSVMPLPVLFQLAARSLRVNLIHALNRLYAV